MDAFPRSYSEWKICITEKCKIPLTADFVKLRIEALSDEKSEERQKFTQLYGAQWTKTVLGYFQQASKEIN